MNAIERLGENAIESGMLELSRDTMMKLWDLDPKGTFSSFRQPFLDLSKEIGLNFPQPAIKLLTDRTYWTRTWIAREFSVAKNLVIACGSKRVPFRQLGAGFVFLAMHRSLLGKTFEAIHDREDPAHEETMKKFQQFVSNCESGAPCHLVGFRN